MNTRSSMATSGIVAGATLLGAATLFIASAPAVQAAPDGRPHDRLPISVAELDARRAQIFAKVDSDGDGLISSEEFAQAELPRHHPRAGHQHQKGERRAPTGEMTGARNETKAATEERLFGSLDTDNDGAISREEFSIDAMREARRTARRTQMFEHIDTDGDGYLSEAEFPPRRLANLDANGDGEITRDELPDRPGRRFPAGGASE